MTSSSDAVVLPPCHTASLAQKARHDDIKNGFLFFDDDILLSRLRDDARTKGLTDRVQEICRDINGFSGGYLVQQLAPLKQLERSDRMLIKNYLDREFFEGFRPSVAVQRIEASLAEFIQSLQTLLAAGSGSPESVLKQIGVTRNTLIALSQRLSDLPRGFWLPRAIQVGEE